MIDPDKVKAVRDRIQAIKESQQKQKQVQDAWFDLDEELSLLRALKRHVLHDRKQQNFFLWSTSGAGEFEDRIDRIIKRIEEEKDILWRMLMKEI